MASILEHCLEAADKGPCLDEESRWHFVPFNRSCVNFAYGGCEGNDNNFFSEHECYSSCGGSHHGSAKRKMDGYMQGRDHDSAKQRGWNSVQQQKDKVVARLNMLRDYVVSLGNLESKMLYRIPMNWSTTLYQLTQLVYIRLNSTKPRGSDNVSTRHHNVYKHDVSTPSNTDDRIKSEKDFESANRPSFDYPKLSAEDTLGQETSGNSLPRRVTYPKRHHHTTNEDLESKSTGYPELPKHRHTRGTQEDLTTKNTREYNTATRHPDAGNTDMTSDMMESLGISRHTIVRKTTEDLYRTTTTNPHGVTWIKGNNDALPI